jgi:hypothetical protein
MNRTTIVLSEAQWSRIEDAARRLPPGHAIIDFWREAMQLTVEEWDRLPRHSFSVQDYEVSQADFDRLEAVLLSKANGKMNKQRVAMILLDKGPVVALQ